MLKLAAVCAAVFLIGCGRTVTSGADCSERDFPIVQLTYSDRVDFVILRADYGYIVDWPGDRAPVYYVFDKRRRTRARVETWEAFIGAMRQVPDGSEIDEVSKCTVSFAWGMPDEKYDELSALVAQKRLQRVAADDVARHTGFCYCETQQLSVLAGPAR